MSLFIISVLAFVQVDFQDINLNYYDTRSGLSSNIIYDVYQDHQGFIWVATENGLNRFDAYDFKAFYYSQSDSTSISNNVVRSIYESSNGDLWFGTRKGISLFKRKEEKFTRFSVPDSFNITSNDVHILKPDSKNKLWYIAHSRLIYFDSQKQVYGEVKLPFLLYNLVIDANDIMWLTGYKGELFKYSIKKAELTEVSKLEEGVLLSFFLGSDGESILYNSVDKEISVEGWKQLPRLQNNIKTERFFQDTKGRRWFGTEEGLFLQEAGNTPQKVDLQREISSNLANIKSIFEDKTGGIWIGTINGLYHIDSGKKKFKELNIEGPDRTVMAIEEVDGSWWVNNFSQRLTQYISVPENKFIEAKSIVLPNGVNQIWDMQQINENVLWLATEQGLYELNKSTSKAFKVDLSSFDNKDKVLFSISRSGTDTYWLGGYGALLNIDPKTRKVLRKIEILNEYDGALVQDVLVLNDEELLIATETHGLFYYSEESGLSKKWDDFEIGNQLDQTSIWDLFQSSNNTIWAGGNNGLIRINNPIDFAEPQKMNIGDNRIVFSITEDKNGIIWMGTDKGLIQFNPDTDVYRLYTTEDEIRNSEFNRRSIFTSNKGMVVAGGMGGVVYFNPDEIEINKNEPEVWITDFRVIMPDSVIDYSIFGINELSLDWQKNTIEIDFTALGYTNTLQNQYRYQLVGHDPDWVSPKNSRQARYVRLPAGEYTFNVIASNSDEIWNEVGDSINIVIQPPFWQTNWFRGILLLIFIMIVWSLYRFRVGQLLEVERVRLRIAGDLHDEIGSGLSGIALTGDLLQNQARAGNPKPEMIERITTNARGLASSLDSIVWLIDPNKETILDLIIKCKRTANELLINHKVIIEDKIPESYHTKELPSLMRRNCFLLYKEAIHNIVKHAEANIVEILFLVENEELVFSIIDNGIGFKEQEVLKGKGLDGMQRRAKEMSGVVRINSEKDKGTTIYVRKLLP